MDSTEDLLVDLSGLRLTASWRPMAFDDWADVAILASAFPFSGTRRTVVTKADPIDFRNGLSSLSVPGRVVFGGGRAVYLALDIHKSDGDGDHLTIEVSVAPSEDDPWPMLHFLLFGVGPSFVSHSEERVTQFLLKKEVT